jgi:hypothetical protein
MAARSRLREQTANDVSCVLAVCSSPAVTLSRRTVTTSDWDPLVDGAVIVNLAGDC